MARLARSHLRPVADTDDADDEPAIEVDDAPHVTVDEVSITFTGALAKLQFHPKTAALQVIITIDDRAEITNRDLARLRYRLLNVTLEPRDAAGRATDPRVDPVRARLDEDRLNRAMDQWVVDMLIDEWDVDPDDADDIDGAY